jgi:hypothetical protein
LAHVSDLTFHSRVGHYNGLMLNWSLALGGYALGGAVWAACAFLAVALLRVSVETQALRHHNAALRRRLLAHEGPFAANDFLDESDAPPNSEIRASVAPLERPRLVSQH